MGTGVGASAEDGSGTGGAGVAGSILSGVEEGVEVGSKCALRSDSISAATSSICVEELESLCAMFKFKYARLFKRIRLGEPTLITGSEPPRIGLRGFFLIGAGGLRYTVNRKLLCLQRNNRMYGIKRT